MAKITRATFKSFIKNNSKDLFIRNDSSFDGMSDCVEHNQDAQFHPVEKSKHNLDHTLGINGVWLVGQSRDYFKEFQDNKFEGIEVYNSCGSFVVAKPKA